MAPLTAWQQLRLAVDHLGALLATQGRVSSDELVVAIERVQHLLDRVEQEA